MAKNSNRLRVRRLGINTRHEAVIFMSANCAVSRSEGFTAHARVRVTNGEHTTIATLYQITSDILDHEEAGLSDSAWERLHLKEGDAITVSHARPLESLSKVRSKAYGQVLEDHDMKSIINDVVNRRYSDIHLSSFITACAAHSLNHEEMISLTSAMIDAGHRLSWDKQPIADKHCVGGLPGNRTTPIVVAIVASCGLWIPKTSSRAITSPAGTADTMETLAPVDLDLKAMRNVVEREGGCIVWGGSVGLSPADDTLIRVERALDLDSDAQLVASVLSKKIAAGSSHVIIDMPVGSTAKIRSQSAAEALRKRMTRVAASFGLTTQITVTDGSQPVGRGIGPALEARDVLAVLQNKPEAPLDLRERAVLLAGQLLELAGVEEQGRGEKVAFGVLEDGRAWSKFQRICEAQGGMREPPTSKHRREILALMDGRVSKIDNRRLALVAKLAGAPDDKTAGIEIHVKLGAVIIAGQPLYTIHAESPGELAYAIAYVEENKDIIGLAN